MRGPTKAPPSPPVTWSPPFSESRGHTQWRRNKVAKTLHTAQLVPVHPVHRERLLFPLLFLAPDLPPRKALGTGLALFLPVTLL